LLPIREREIADPNQNQLFQRSVEKRVGLRSLCGGSEDGWRRKRSREIGAWQRCAASSSLASIIGGGWEWCYSAATAGFNDPSCPDLVRIHGELQ
jgi:hypothetical protein